MQLSNKNKLLIIFSVLFFFLLSPCWADKKPNELIFGIHPYLHATTLIERFTPLMDHISEQMDTHIHIRVATSYQDHIDAIANGGVDFAYMGPASYIKLTEINKNYPLLGKLSFSGKKSFRGAIIIRNENTMTQINQLKGKKFAFGDPNSTLSSKVPQKLLAQEGVQLTDLKKFTHLKNHHNVALAVLMGKYDAGGIKEEVFNEYQSRGLKVLKWMPNIPTHPFIATPKMTVEQIRTLRQILHNLHNKDILQKIKKGTTAIISADDGDYNELRQLISDKADIINTEFK